MNIFERRYKALRILSQLPDAAHGSIMTKLGGGAPYDDPANFDAFADKLADLFDIGALRDNPPGCVYVGPGEGVVIEPNRGHPAPAARFSIHKDGRDRYDVHVNGQLLGSGPFHTPGVAYEAALKALGVDRDRVHVTACSRRDHWEYEVQS